MLLAESFHFACHNGDSKAAVEALGVDAAAVAAQHISQAGSSWAIQRQTGQDTGDPLCLGLCCLCLVQLQLRLLLHGRLLPHAVAAQVMWWGDVVKGELACFNM